MGWPGIYSICFSQLDGDKDSFPLVGIFSTFIVTGLLRDNEEAVTEDYLTSLIGEIWFDLEDKSLLRFILLPLLMWFGFIYRIWAFRSLLLALGANKLGFLLGPAPRPRAFHRACLFLGLWWVGPHTYFQNLSYPQNNLFIFNSLYFK